MNRVRRRPLPTKVVSWTTLVSYLLFSHQKSLASQHVRKESRRKLSAGMPLLGVCVGGCDGDDSMCEMGLSCFSRSRREPVPGCEDEAANGSWGEDFCYEPKAGVLVYVGDNISGAFHPASALPLSACQGDCDKDSDCDANLRCRIRKYDEVVPGCTGGGVTALDYCYDPTSTDIEANMQLILADPPPTVSTPLGQCAGNCTGDDSLCQIGLSCFARKRRELVPGCQGKGAKGADYCYVPPEGVLVNVGDKVDGVVFPNEAVFPLEACQGNCNSDNDCKGSLICSTRTEGNEAVAGCNGTGIANIDYCFDPQPSSTPSPSRTPTTSSPTLDTPSPTLAPTQTPQPSATPKLVLTSGDNAVGSLDQCEGDCGGDDVMCQYGLSCFSRKGIEPVPGCLGKGLSGTSYCYQPSEGELVYKGDDQDADEGAFPLAACQGDCDDDWDCKADLLCFMREAHEPVPGCTGRGVSGRDYCYRPDNSTNGLEPAAKEQEENSGGGDDGLSNAAVISIIVVSVVTANICLCICCKWLLSRDPTDVRGKNTSHIAPQLDADGAVLLQSVNKGSGNNTESTSSDSGLPDVGLSGPEGNFPPLEPGPSDYSPVDHTNEII